MLDSSNPAITKEFIREWVDALRSGEYRQGGGVLRSSDDRFCCLGVACDLLGVARYTDDRVATAFDFSDDFVSETTVPFEWGISKVALPLPEGKEWYRSQESREWPSEWFFLSDANDELGLSFDQIADVIEWAWLS